MGTFDRVFLERSFKDALKNNQSVKKDADLKVGAVCRFCRFRGVVEDFKALDGGRYVCPKCHGISFDGWLYNANGPREGTAMKPGTVGGGSPLPVGGFAPEGGNEPPVGEVDSTPGQGEEPTTGAMTAGSPGSEITFEAPGKIREIEPRISLKTQLNPGKKGTSTSIIGKPIASVSAPPLAQKQGESISRRFLFREERKADELNPPQGGRGAVGGGTAVGISVSPEGPPQEVEGTISMASQKQKGQGSTTIVGEKIGDAEGKSITCPDCGRKYNGEDSDPCPHCGNKGDKKATPRAKLDSASLTCPQCGFSGGEGDFTPSTSTPAPSGDNPVVAPGNTHEGIALVDIVADGAKGRLTIKKGTKLLLKLEGKILWATHNKKHWVQVGAKEVKDLSAMLPHMFRDYHAKEETTTSDIAAAMVPLSEKEKEATGYVPEEQNQGELRFFVCPTCGVREEQKQGETEKNCPLDGVPMVLEPPVVSESLVRDEEDKKEKDEEDDEDEGEEDDEDKDKKEDAVGKGAGGAEEEDDKIDPDKKDEDDDKEKDKEDKDKKDGFVTDPRIARAAKDGKRPKNPPMPRNPPMPGQPTKPVVARKTRESVLAERLLNRLVK